MNSDKYWSEFHKLKMLNGNLLKLIDVVVTMDPKNCVCCEFFEESTEVCKKASARPPAKVIVTGCELFENNDDIPF